MARVRVGCRRGFELMKIPGRSAGATGRRTNVTDDHRSDSRRFDRPLTVTGGRADTRYEWNLF